MSQDQTSPSGPDLAQGVALADLLDGKLVGHVGDQEVLLVRTASQIFAVDAHCTHYHAPLVDGIVVGDSVRCPWHHACFDLRSGEATCAPAFGSLGMWQVEQRGDRVFVQSKASPPSSPRPVSSDAPKQIVIVGGGAAGFAAAEMLRREQYDGNIVMISAESALPVDRPNLSKDYLAGNAPEDWLPLRSEDFYRDEKIDLRLQAEVGAIDVKKQQVTVLGVDPVSYDRLLLATGAEPVRLQIPGANQHRVHTLRSLADCRAIIEAAGGARRALVIGASFIGLEVAASLRARDIEVHVVAPERRPMERVLGNEMGDFVRALHEEHGVIFHLEDTVASLDGGRATLRSGQALDVDLVIAGVGVRPRLALAEQAGLTMDRGVMVDAYLQTSARGVFAAGDIARWPDPHSGMNVRVEHWAVAERQGQVAALNMLGQKRVFDAVPFFWSQHYDIPINYVGHAEKWDEIVVDGSIADKDCLLRYKLGGRVVAVASIFRDAASLEAELQMERAIRGAA
jgi:NADPH-dependent 2,4-dienoyl-CoA reductase/sulfur reductase-like enzyme/nitrite reductase/ring-hydroxylating ferredoxin subunit